MEVRRVHAKEVAAAAVLAAVCLAAAFAPGISFFCTGPTTPAAPVARRDAPDARPARGPGDPAGRLAGGPGQRSADCLQPMQPLVGQVVLRGRQGRNNFRR